MAESPNIADLKPYKDYKCAGLPWLDAIPHHWEMVPNRALMREQREVVGNNATNHTLLSLTLRGVIARDMVNPKGKFPAQFDMYKIVKPNDFVFCLFDIDETPRGVGLSMLNGMITGAYDVFSPTSRVNPSFLYYYYLSVDQGKLLKPLYTGLRKTIPRSVFASLKAPLPQPEEQDAIVRFLGWATSRLDRAIRAKRKVISLLNEQKQAIIHRAVTRGLDASVPLKPSGIPWIGEIPKHWELTKLKYISPQITVGIVIQPARFYVSQGIPALRSLNISSGTITKDALVYISEEGHLANFKSRLHEGDVVAVRTGRAGIAVVIPPELDGANCVDLLIIRKSRRILSEYLLMFLQSYGAKEDIAFNSVGAIQAHYNTGTLANLRIPLPPMEEQHKLIVACQDQLAPIDVGISRLEHETSLLLEYRTRLVSDVVTGKLDVREAAMNLPDEASVEAAQDADTDLDQGEFEEEEVEA